MPQSVPQPIRVLCVDDSGDVRDALSHCISMEPDMESVGSLDCADEVPDVVEKTHADVVLMDMRMPGKDPLDVIAELTSAESNKGRPVRVILFSGLNDSETIDAAFTAGANGFLSKSASIPTILDAIREVAKEEATFGVWR